MGLDIAVGVLKLERQQGADDADLAAYAEQFQLLNAVLAEAGLPPHQEPSEVSETFEAQMYGYIGLHTVRRLAAWVEIEGRLPPEHGRDLSDDEDPAVGELNSRLTQYYNSRRSPAPRSGWLGRVLKSKNQSVPKPSFQHLLWHSDAEGFYVPQRFEDVVFDMSPEPRPGVGGMIGSSFALYDECARLAEKIELPADIDPESDELWELADNPAIDGPPWRQFGVEAFCLARLVRAARLSIATGAAVVFR